MTTPLSSATAASRCSSPRISICSFMNSGVKLGIYSVSITERPKFLKSRPNMASASFSSMERPIIRLCNPRLTCFLPTNLYKGPRDAPMDKIVE